MAKTTWAAPTKLSWGRWLAFYGVAIAANAAWVWRLQEDNRLPVTEALWVTLAGFVPALLLVSLALLLRYGWYQLWWVYQRSNEAVYEQKMAGHKQYWSESVGVAQVLFRCGTLADFEAFETYLSLTGPERQKAMFDTMSRHIPSLASDEQAGYGGPGRGHEGDRTLLLAAALAEQLGRSGAVPKALADALWVWAGRAADWPAFRGAYVALGHGCPQQPDLSADSAPAPTQWQWVVDRIQEAPQRTVVLLGFHGGADLECLYATVLSAKGDLARLHRAFALAATLQQPQALKDSLPVTAVSSQSLGQGAGVAALGVQLNAALGLRHVASTQAVPSFVALLPPAQQPWLLLLAGIGCARRQQVPVLLHWPQHVVPVCLAGQPA